MIWILGGPGWDEMKTTLLVACVTSGLTFVPEVHACSCPMPQSAASALQAANAAFAGWVLGLEIIPGTGKDPTRYRARVYVTHHWKGPTRQRFEVWTNRGDAACGMSFELMDFVLVYATREKGKHRYWTSWCDRSHKVGKYDDFTILRSQAKILAQPPSF